MSDQSDAGKTASVPRGVNTPLEREIARRKAKQRHRSHYRDQALAWAFVIVLAVLSYPLQYTYQQHFLAACRVGPSPLALCMAHYLGLALPSLGLFAFLVWCGAFNYLSLQKWAVALSNAQQTISPQNVTKGYTDLFNIFMRTKRRSYLLAGWGVLAFVYALVGTIINIGVSAPALFWLMQLVEVLFGVVLILFGYKMGSIYLPGDVIVRHTLALSIFAISDVNNVEEARLQAEKDAAQFVRDNPWWFYPG
jgi:hypothetical protein